MSCIAVDIVAHELARAKRTAQRVNNTRSVQNQAREHYWWCDDFLERLRRQELVAVGPSVSDTCRKCKVLVTTHNGYMCQAWFELQDIKATCKDYEEAVDFSSDRTAPQALVVEHHFTALETLIKDLEDLCNESTDIGKEVGNHKILEKRIAMDQIQTFVSGLMRLSEQDVKEQACCAICMDLYFENIMATDEVVQLPCDDNHAFHSTCISAWFQKENTCPFDRRVAFPSIMDEL